MPWSTNGEKWIPKDIWREEIHRVNGMAEKKEKREKRAFILGKKEKKCKKHDDTKEHHFSK